MQAYLPLAEKGDSNAQYWMGLLSQHIGKNASQSLYWYEKAALQGNTEAMNALALGYSEYANESNISVAFGCDPQKERYWKQQSAERGDHDAQCSLGLDYKCEGDIENAISMYSQAITSSNCRIVMTACSGLANIYGNNADKQHYNAALQREYLTRILKMKQTHPNDADAYDEDKYGAAALSMSTSFLLEYRKTKDPLTAKRCVYCNSLAFLSNACFESMYKDTLRELNYTISNEEWQLWNSHAQMLSFDLP